MYVLKSQISNLKPTKSLMLRIVKRYFQGCVGTFPRNAILMGDQISRRSLLQRTLQVSLDFPFLNKICSSDLIINTRINDLSKEAILQCINDGDLRFLSVTWCPKIKLFMNILFSYSLVTMTFPLQVDFQPQSNFWCGVYSCWKGI